MWSSSWKQEKCLKETRKGTAIAIKLQKCLQLLQCHELQHSPVIVITSPKYIFRMRKAPQIAVTCLGQLPPPTQKREAENVDSE